MGILDTIKAEVTTDEAKAAAEIKYVEHAFDLEYNKARNWWSSHYASFDVIALAVGFVIGWLVRG